MRIPSTSPGPAFPTVWRRSAPPVSAPACQAACCRVAVDNLELQLRIWWQAAKDRMSFVALSLFLNFKKQTCFWNTHQLLVLNSATPPETQAGGRRAAPAPSATCWTMPCAQAPGQASKSALRGRSQDAGRFQNFISKNSISRNSVPTTLQDPAQILTVFLILWGFFI